MLVALVPPPAIRDRERSDDISAKNGCYEVRLVLKNAEQFYLSFQTGFSVYLVFTAEKFEFEILNR